jgi:HEPN domain-containing protein
VSAPAPPGVTPSQRIAFPHQDEYAREFFGEAVRHLEDARTLHRMKRYAEAITSAMKAAELGVKAVLILDGSMGWWEKLQQTHTPLDDMRHHPVLKYHYQRLEQHDHGVLVADVMLLEKLVPSRPGAGSLDLATQENPEYPFFFLDPGHSGVPPSSHLVGPRHHFTETDSTEHYRTARRLLGVYQTLYPQVKAWKHRLPKPI